MNTDLDTLYRELMLSLTEKRLGLLASRLIAAHREKNYGLIRIAASVLLDEQTETLADTALFARVIKQCHPDRTQALRKEAEKAFEQRDREALDRLNRLFRAERESASAAIRKQPVYRSEPEMYEAETDYGPFDENINFEDYLEEEEEAWSEDEEVSFLSVLREELLGNLDFALSPADLIQLDGELDLSARDLTELKGLEYCRNIEILNLSENGLGRIGEIASLIHLRELYIEGNDISDLSPLAKLRQLEILDCSSNDVEDISPLLHCTGLRFADLRRNPLKNHKGIIRMLEDRGVVLLV